MHDLSVSLGGGTSSERDGCLHIVQTPPTAAGLPGCIWPGMLQALGMLHDSQIPCQLTPAAAVESLLHVGLPLEFGIMHIGHRLSVIQVTWKRKKHRIQA